MPPSDHRSTPADERTLLAWLRTGLALVAGGVAGATSAPDLGVRWGSAAVALGLVVVGQGGPRSRRRPPAIVPAT